MEMSPVFSAILPATFSVILLATLLAVATWPVLPAPAMFGRGGKQ